MLASDRLQKSKVFIDDNSRTTPNEILSKCRRLKSAEGFIRTRLAKMVNLRNTPEVSFVLDQSIEYGVRMSRLIDEVAEEDAKKGKESQERSQTDGNS